jgi:phosphate transport system substrate-binding protein
VKPKHVLALALGFAAAGCGGGASDGAGKLVLTGSSTIAPLMSEIAKRFEALHPGVRVDVQTGGSSRGVADARSGLADVGMASRALKAGEEDLHAFAVARDGVCLFVHSDNTVTELTDEQVAAIYTGGVESWSEVGGPEAPVTVVSKAEGRATLEVFLDYFGLESAEIQADVIVGDNEHAVKTVAADPNAVAYVSIGTAEHNAENGTPIRLLPAGGVPCAAERVADGTFPLGRPLNLVTRDEPSGLVEELIDYARSAEVHDLVRELYFVPVR